MKYQSWFSEKNKKYISKCRLKFYPECILKSTMSEKAGEFHHNLQIPNTCFIQIDFMVILMNSVIE